MTLKSVVGSFVPSGFNPALIKYTLLESDTPEVMKSSCSSGIAQVFNTEGRLTVLVDLAQIKKAKVRIAVYTDKTIQASDEDESTRTVSAGQRRKLG